MKTRFAEKEILSFEDLQWQEKLLRAETYQNRLQVLKQAVKAPAFSAAPARPEPGKGAIVLKTAPGEGKVSDAGYDKFACVYAAVPVSFDFSFSAEITLLSFLPEGQTTHQEGFGLFLRDTVENDPETGYPYSNMTAVGGYYGCWNVFSRCGVGKDDLESVSNSFLYGKTADTAPYRTDASAPRRFRLRLERSGSGVLASMRDENGRNMLRRQPEDLPSSPGVGRFFFDENGDAVLPLPPETFAERDREYVYAGIFAAGCAVSADPESVKFVLRARPDEPAETDALYASPEGSCLAYGTKDAPWDLQTAVFNCRNGQQITLLPGTYRLKEDLVIGKKHSGDPERPRRLVSPEPGAAVLDFGGSSFGLKLQGDNWVIDGVAVTRGMGFRVQGSRNRLLRCTAFRNREAGFLLRHERNDSDREDWPSGNLVEDCVSFENRDVNECAADGFACKIAAGEGNRFVRCLSFLNADDGFDLFAKNRRTGAVRLSGCRSVLNGFALTPEGTLRKTAGNGTGFKLGGSGLAVGHGAEDCEAFGNRGAGFTSNSNPLMELKDCLAGANGGKNFEFYYTGRAARAKKQLKGCREQNDPVFNAAEWLGNVMKDVMPKGISEDENVPGQRHEEE